MEDNEDKNPVPPAPGITGTVVPGGRPGYTRVQMTLTAEQVEQLRRQGCIVKRMPDAGNA